MRAVGVPSPEGGGDLAPPTQTLVSMAHEQGSSHNNDDPVFEGGDASTADHNGADAVVPGTLVDLPVEVDPETAELLRTLEMPSTLAPRRAGDDDDNGSVPLSGVLRRPRRQRPRAEDVDEADGGDEAALHLSDGAVPDVIAYEPIRVEAPWSAGELTPMEVPARRIPSASDLPPATVPEVDVTAEFHDDLDDDFEDSLPPPLATPDMLGATDAFDSGVAPAPADFAPIAEASAPVDVVAAPLPPAVAELPPLEDDLDQVPSLELEVASETDEFESGDLDVGEPARQAAPPLADSSAATTTADGVELDAEELDELEVEELDSPDAEHLQRPRTLPMLPAPGTAAAQAAEGQRRAVGAAPPKPPPPKAPPPAPPAPPPRLKQGEFILTQDALDDMLAGGRTDDGRDLANDPSPHSEWYREIFTEDFFRTLPRNFHKQTVRETEFVIDRLGVEPGARLLDLCCGFGRHTMELARRNFEVVGLDLAMPLLQKALNEAQRRNLSIKFVHGDMRQLNFQGVFDGIFNVQTSFGYFTDRVNFKVLQGIFRALKPGGRFFVETINRDFVCEEIPMRIWWEGTECLILEEVDFDYSSSTLKVKRSFVYEDASREPWEHHIHIRLYSPHELQYLLRRAGFEIIELSGDYNSPGRFFGSASRRVVIVAERPID